MNLQIPTLGVVSVGQACQSGQNINFYGTNNTCFNGQEEAISLH